MLPRLWSTREAFPAFAEFDTLFRAMHDELAQPETATPTYAAPVDVFEHEDRYEFWLDVPGVNREDLKLSIENDTLRLTGERPAQAETEQNGKFYRRVERWTGSFSRTFTLPNTVDSTRIEAKLQDGVLKLILPKREQAKPRQITITG